MHDAGLTPWVFIAPMLPMHPQRLHELISPYVGRVMLDPLNYRGQVRGLFKSLGWDYALTDAYAAETGESLRLLFGNQTQ